MQREKILGRLVRLRQMEEEVSRIELESAAVERDRLLRYRRAVEAAGSVGREDFVRGVENEDPVVSQAGLLAVEQSRSAQDALAHTLKSVEMRMERLQAEFFRRRTSTHQAETLMEQARAERNAEDARRLQQVLDDWFADRRRSGDPK